MKAALLATAALGLVVGLVAGVVAYLRPGDASLVADVYLLFLGGVLLLVLVHGTGRPRIASDSFELERELRRPARPQRPLPELSRVEREVELATMRAFDVHLRLRPLLREVAEARLINRAGIDLDAEPDRARAALGEDLWELVRADRPPPPDRHAPGLLLSDLRALVDAVERI